MTNSESVIDWRKRTKQRMVLAMGGGCVCCGYNKCNRNLAFHHLDPKEKDFNFGSIRANILSWDRIVSELRKCVLVCHNCHGEIHEGILNLPPDFPRFDERYTDYRKFALLDVPKKYCKICEIEITKNLTYCSPTCYSKSSERVDWSKVDLIELKKQYSNVQIGKMLGVSEASIRKRLKKF